MKIMEAKTIFVYEFWIISLAKLEANFAVQMPEWPSGEVSASRPEGSRLKPDSTEDPSCIGPVWDSA
ncbi:hypothetical protein AVEN_185423-1 [Araneus ventricosus]|uniref:Uncharacterized protein n=1 Tax=Araneus ventricosus TaxID=182803 RepID=A0A4Y2CHW2_ARAVE|nr:hypothetical protein AVEN_185423-1 [Araneus ventricosus]